MLENLTGKPVVGIIPYFRDIAIEQEDSVVLDQKTSTATNEKINIAVVLLRHMSNFTDFNMLEQVPEIHLFYTADPQELLKADIIIIPGSKNTIADMLHLRNSGLAKMIVALQKEGKSVYGICGGYQIMGLEINDPQHIEGEIESIPGLGILPVITTLTNEKKTEQCRFTFLQFPEINTGYEIHMGITHAQKESPLCKINDETIDGYFLNSKTWGSYIHGIFDNQSIIENILQQVNASLKVSIDYRAFKDEQYNKLANLVRSCIDMDYIYKELAK